MHKIIFFPENLKKILGFTSKFRYGRVTLNTGIFSFGPIQIISALDKLLGQLGNYATWLSLIGYLQEQLHIFYFFTPRFWQ